MDVSLSCLRNVRPPVTSHAPSIWAADAFSTYSLEEQVEKKYDEAIEELKQEAGGMLMAAAIPIKQMVLIDTFERLGLAYHFETEIEQKLREIDVHGDHSNLFTTALRFRLLRQHQHRISCNVFAKFVGEDGKFKETLSSDAEGLLSLYEAAHVRFRNEEILEEAARFTRHHLSCMESKLESPLKEKVKRALECPLHREVPIFYTRFFISIYENDDSMDELLLKLAKFNFNFLQIMYKKELCELFRWWNTFDNLKSKLPYARDRLAEAYIWSAGYHYEPQYSYVRMGLTKCIQISGIMDDTYDNYATLNEAQLLTEILDRWTTDETDHQVPNYMKIVFHFIMSMYEDYERDAVKQGKMFAASYFKETVQQLGKAYNKELKWVMKKKMPSFQEYTKNSEITSVLYLMFASIILGLKSVTQETIDWVKSRPNLVLSTTMIGRYYNDIGSHERESKEGEMLTAVNCYMKQYGVSKQETISKFEEAIEDAWKDVNEGWVATTSVPKETTVQFLNYARMCNACYNRNNADGYSDSQVFKAHIASLFIDPIKI